MALHLVLAEQVYIIPFKKRLLKYNKVHFLVAKKKSKQSACPIIP